MIIPISCCGRVLTNTYCNLYSTIENKHFRKLFLRHLKAYAGKKTGTRIQSAPTLWRQALRQGLHNKNNSIGHHLNDLHDVSKTLHSILNGGTLDYSACSLPKQNPKLGCSLILQYKLNFRSLKMQWRNPKTYKVVAKSQLESRNLSKDLHP